MDVNKHQQFFLVRLIDFQALSLMGMIEYLLELVKGKAKLEIRKSLSNAGHLVHSHSLLPTIGTTIVTILGGGVSP